MICDILTNIFVHSLRLPEAVYADNQDMLGEVFVPSVDTVSLSLSQIRTIDGI